MRVKIATPAFILLLLKAGYRTSVHAKLLEGLSFLYSLEEVLHGDHLDGNCTSRGGTTHDDDGSVLLNVERPGVEESKESGSRDAVLHQLAQEVGQDQEERL
jgi:hypothetical protein